MERILITSALLYANGPLHFGHIAGAYLPADCYARFKKMQDVDVLFISGSDEYGVAITLSAEIAHRTPKEHVDLYHKINQDLFKKFNIQFDHYSRTTADIHKKTAQEFFLKLYENGFIIKKVENHLYSEKEKRFLADRYVIGKCPKCGFEKARGDECTKCGASYEAVDLKNPTSKLSGDKLILKPSTHWYLLFDEFKKQLNEWISTKKWKPAVLNFTKNYIDDLRPRAITRDSSWGIPVPLKEAKDKVLYVWFDAPIGYISATKEWAKNDKWKKYWLNEKTKLVHFIGKDNIPFHTVFFPAMLMGQEENYKLVDEVPANEFFMLEGKQFSKSDNWYINLDDFFKKYTADQIRYCIAANAPENSDSEFTYHDFQMRCNAELVGKLGNFVHRVLTFAHNNTDSKVPDYKDFSSVDKDFIKKSYQLVDEAYVAYENFQLRKASQLIMQLASLGNSYFDTKKPWAALKKKDLLFDMKNTIYLCMECIKLLSLIAYPIIPDSANKMYQMLGQKKALSQEKFYNVKKNELKQGQQVKKPDVLFKKIEDEEIKKEIDNLYKNKEDQANLINYEDFSKLDMRVGQILEAEKVEKSSKLLKLIIDIGNEKRQIVAGIGKFYKCEDLIGKKVVVLVNLKPAKLMGIESQGMLLAAGKEAKLLLLPEAKVGDKIG